MAFLLQPVGQSKAALVDQTFSCIAAFEITIDHPHTHVVKCTQLVRGECPVFFSGVCVDQCIGIYVCVCVFVCVVVPASKDLAQTSYFMATNR